MELFNITCMWNDVVFFSDFPFSAKAQVNTFEGSAISLWNMQQIIPSEEFPGSSHDDAYKTRKTQV